MKGDGKQGGRSRRRIVSSVHLRETWQDLGLTAVEKVKVLLHVERAFEGTFVFPDEVADRLGGIQEVVDYIKQQRACGVPIHVKPLIAWKKGIVGAYIGPNGDLQVLETCEDWHSRWRI